MKFLLIEDDPTQAGAVSLALEVFDIEADVIHQSSGSRSIETVLAERPDVVLLDLGLPGEDGISVLRRIREVSNVPVVVVSGRNNPTAIARALEQGADDYIVKPFHAIELQARIQAVTRRARLAKAQSNVLDADGVRIDFELRSLNVDGARVDLSRQEWDVLACLWRNRNRTVDRETLRRTVWHDADVSDTAISMAVSRLRHKMGSAGELVNSSRGSGYALVVPETEPAAAR